MEAGEDQVDGDEGVMKAWEDDDAQGEWMNVSGDDKSRYVWKVHLEHYIVNYFYIRLGIIEKD